MPANDGVERAGGDGMEDFRGDPSDGPVAGYFYAHPDPVGLIYWSAAPPEEITNQLLCR